MVKKWNWDNHKHVPTNTRNRILKRDQHTCQHCGQQLPPHLLEVDHKDNRRTETYNNPDNLQTLCIQCHARKTRQETLAGKKHNKSRHPREPHPGIK